VIHLKKSHRSELLKASVLAKNGSDQKMELIRLRYLHNFRLNTKVLQDGNGELIVYERSEIPRPAIDYLPCVHCLAFFISEQLGTHVLSCKFRVGADNVNDDAVSVTKDARMLLTISSLSDAELDNDKSFTINVLEKMRLDELYRLVVSDGLIRKFGAYVYRMKGTVSSHEVILLMRHMGLLVKTVNCKHKLDLRLSSLISGDHFAKIVEATDSLCEAASGDVTEQSTTFSNSYFARTIGKCLLDCANIKKGLSIRDDDSVSLIEANSYTVQHTSAWPSTISGQCFETFESEITDALPHAPIRNDALIVIKDLVKLNSYMKCKIALLTNDLRSTDPFEYSRWRELMELVLCNLTVFNSYKSSESSRLLISEYIGSPESTLIIYKEILASLTPLERFLLKRLVLLFIMCFVSFIQYLFVIM